MMEGMNRAARMTRLMSILRGVDEILYSVSLLQLGEAVQKTFRVVTPVTFNEFMGLFTPITIKWIMLSRTA